MYHLTASAQARIRGLVAKARVALLAPFTLALRATGIPGLEGVMPPAPSRSRFQIVGAALFVAFASTIAPAAASSTSGGILQNAVNFLKSMHDGMGAVLGYVCWVVYVGLIIDLIAERGKISGITIGLGIAAVGATLLTTVDSWGPGVAGALI